MLSITVCFPHHIALHINAIDIPNSTKARNSNPFADRRSLPAIQLSLQADDSQQ
ncbi:MAG: hypothetical protein SVX43_10780 [Cyanobacteriota bacterium]|nr:hypothetical protein [Cyanobacteriota bacterium]